MKKILKHFSRETGRLEHLITIENEKIVSIKDCVEGRQPYLIEHLSIKKDFLRMGSSRYKIAGTTLIYVEEELEKPKIDYPEQRNPLTFIPFPSVVQVPVSNTNLSLNPGMAVTISSAGQIAGVTNSTDQVIGYITSINREYSMNGRDITNVEIRIANN